MTSDEIQSLLRHGYTAAGTALTIGTMIAVIPPDAVQPAIAALHDMGDGLQQAFGGASKLVLLFGPIIAGISTKIAMLAVSLKSQVAKVHEAAPHELMIAVADQAPATLAKATAALLGVQVEVSGNASATLRTLASDPDQPDIVKAPRLESMSTASPLSRKI